MLAFTCRCPSCCPSPCCSICCCGWIICIDISILLGIGKEQLEELPKLGYVDAADEARCMYNSSGKSWLYSSVDMISTVNCVVGPHCGPNENMAQQNCKQNQMKTNENNQKCTYAWCWLEGWIGRVSKVLGNFVGSIALVTSDKAVQNR